MFNSSFNPDLVVPKPIGSEWIWVCKECEIPIIIANRKYYWGCDCHKSTILSDEPVDNSVD